jgi:hypothetical protein
MNKLMATVIATAGGLALLSAACVGFGENGGGSGVEDDLPTGVPPVRQTEEALRSPTPTPVPKTDVCTFDAVVCDTAAIVAKALPKETSQREILALASPVTVICTPEIIGNDVQTLCSDKSVGTTVEGFIFWKTEKALLERTAFAEWLDSVLPAYRPGAATRPLLLACAGDPGKQDCSRYFAVGLLSPWDDGTPSSLMTLFFRQDGDGAALIGGAWLGGGSPAAAGGWHDTSHWAVNLPEKMYFQPVAAEAFR